MDSKTNNAPSPNSQLLSQPLLDPAQNSEKAGLKEPAGQLNYQTITMHSEGTNTAPHRDTKAPHQEWVMSAEYAAFEGYGDQDAQAEMEVYYTEDQEDPWWICFVPFWLR
ncbi:hypothetical protein MKX08_007684 [Trichoderma sp. CBMAI-0020]|nr:hypothetical protein MKX08_007684 [Trichoderma sp. CBMAI-0020]